MFDYRVDFTHFGTLEVGNSRLEAKNGLIFRGGPGHFPGQGAGYSSCPLKRLNHSREGSRDGREGEIVNDLHLLNSYYVPGLPIVIHTVFYQKSPSKTQHLMIIKRAETHRAVQ